MGYRGATPSPKVNTNLLMYAKGIYINPSLLEVFSKVPINPYNSANFLT